MYFRTALLSRYHHQLQLRLPRTNYFFPQVLHNSRLRPFTATSAAMADGVSADLLRSKLTEGLKAQHVEVDDLSGAPASFFLPMYYLMNV